MPSLPKAFAERILEQYPNGQDILDGLKADPTFATFQNPRKSKVNISAPIAWCANGEYVEVLPASDPLLHAGVYFPKEASSQFLDHVLKETLKMESPICLDLCAAPGGSSLILQSHLNGKGLLISNEVNSKRNYTLQESLSKWGYSNKIVIQAKAESIGWLGPIFDFILIDAPSTGEARFRSNHNTREFWNKSDCEHNAKQQKEIVDHGKWGLKTGGILVYNTNTFSKEENEEIVERLCNRGEFEPVDVALEEAWNIEKPLEGAYQFFPHKAKGEGLFMAVLKRVKEVRPAVIKKVQIPIVSPPREIKLGEGLVTIRDKKLHAFPEAYLSYIHHLSNIKTHAVGSVLGEQKGRAFFPDHEVATALQISHAFPHVDVDRNAALSYLKKETFKVDGPEGQIVISYNGHPLGWAKNVGTRINNHYPVSWRLRG